MSFLIDTNICSAYLKDTRKGAGTVFSRFMQYTGQLHLSTVTLAELYTWALRSKAPPPSGPTQHHDAAASRPRCVA